jgi:hypothetical protein
MMLARDGQHRGVVTIPFFILRPDLKNFLRVAGMYFSPSLWSSVMISSTLGRRRALPARGLSELGESVANMTTSSTSETSRALKEPPSSDVSSGRYPIAVASRQAFGA